MRIHKVADAMAFAGSIPVPDHSGRSGIGRILRAVREGGDGAVIEYEKRFGSTISVLRLSGREIRAAYSDVPGDVVEAIRYARDALAKTEKSTMSLLRPGTVCNAGARIRREFVPLCSAGCYVPGGGAAYASSAIMSVTPAVVAGVRRIAVATPPRNDGEPDPATVVAADMCGATEIYRMGGAQAIAAMAYGTESVQKVDKIVGPGGRFVTAAKRAVSGDVGIDMLAGPTELGILSDSTADPRLIALDLVSQAEHGEDSACYLITTSARTAHLVCRELDRLLPGIEREDIVRASLENNGFIAVCRNARDATLLAQELAPEHLQVMTKNPGDAAEGITSPGLVLLGKDAPSSASDYVLGSNHILPTGRQGRIRGSLSVLDFVKAATRLEGSSKSLASASRHIKALAGSEGLYNHYGAVRGRL